MLDQSLKVAVDPFFGANEHLYQMNQEFVATEIKYSLVFEETVPSIRSTPFDWSRAESTEFPAFPKPEGRLSPDEESSESCCSSDLKSTIK